MSEKTDNLTILLTPFGLTTDESRVYLELLENGHQSALVLSRKMHLARTHVYRILDKLAELGLTNQQLGRLGLKFGANSPKQLELLIAKRTGELSTLKSQLPMIFSQLNSLIPEVTAGTKVLSFSGITGLKHITLNSLTAKKYLDIYEMQQDMTAFTDLKFAEEMRRSYVDRGIVTRQLTNHSQIKPFTNVKDYVKKCWQVRYLDRKLLPINFEVLIYNDVYCLYTFKEKEIFCLEIHNQTLADMQKRLFNLAWIAARPMRIVSEQGEAI